MPRPFNDRKFRRFRLALTAFALAYLIGAVVIVFIKSPDFQEAVGDYFTSSQSIPGVQEFRDLPYSDPPNRLIGDLYKPLRSSAVMPAVVLVHGGSWVAGNRNVLDMLEVTRCFADNGFVVFNIDYRLAGDGHSKYPDDIDDIKQAIAWLSQNHSRFNLDPEKIGLLGISSGASSALIAAYTQTGTTNGARVVCSISGPADLSLETDNPNLRKYLSPDKTEIPLALIAEASPINHLKSAIPTILVHGKTDLNVPFSQSVNLELALRKRGVPVRLIAVEGVGHFLAGRSLKLAMAPVIEFFRQTFASSGQIKGGTYP